MKRGRVKGGSIIPATIDTGRRLRSNMAQPIRNMAGSPRGTIGGAAQNIIEITSDDLVQNGGQYKLMGGTPLPMKIVTGRRSKQGPATVVYPVDVLGNYDPSFAGYIYKVLTPDAASGYDPSGLIGLWTQNELAGGVSIDHSGLSHDGAYTAVNLGQAGVPGLGMSAAGYDAATSFNNVWSAALAAAFNGATGTIISATIVRNAGVWTDGQIRYPFNIFVDANNRIFMRRSNVNGDFDFFYIAGGVSKAINQGGLSSTAWVYYGMTWDKPNDQVRFYIDGIQQGATLNGLGVWAGLPIITSTIIGAGFTTPSNIWDGSLGPGLLYSEAKSPEAVAYLSTP